MTTKQKEPSKIYTGTVSSKRQITIPAEAFRALRLEPGDRVTIEVSGGQLHLTPAPSDFEAITRQHFIDDGKPSNAYLEIREARGWLDDEQDERTPQ
ncbi:AbrB/MazE/SpoVT family DNA-binding domain-containing protein [Deinococcus koreensis]|uniref:SpoVT-AbrB domain-containing protein n=1 Tax=Deinococcus koreensis TaxID=2054903 RepID=A0A2K3UV19_9DEIO|nr:AbrB/MazE/SpoVT family DNA-binding domain-containing protein [Deinococcus koreensis]PNY80383.1 hypothetical protein CVO96_02490 [Deinococcus koreensis]